MISYEIDGARVKHGTKDPDLGDASHFCRLPCFRWFPRRLPLGRARIFSNSGKNRKPWFTDALPAMLPLPSRNDAVAPPTFAERARAIWVSGTAFSARGDDRGEGKSAS